MPNLTSAINNTVPISQFNRGLAGKIFEDVRKFGAKVVMKNNTAECVLMSPEEYVALMDELCDLRMMAIAEERLNNLDEDKLISEEEFWKDEGIDLDELDAMEDVEFE